MELKLYRKKSTKANVAKSSPKCKMLSELGKKKVYVKCRALDASQFILYPVI